MRRIFLPASIFFIIIFFIFVLYQLFFRFHEPFPKLAAGRYVGFFPGSLIGVQEQKVYFSVDSDSKAAILRFVIYRAGWGSNHVEIGNIGEKEDLPPVIFSGPEGILRFGGKSISEFYSAGRVNNVASGEGAEWVLFLCPDKVVTADSTVLEAKILSLKAEQANLKLQLAEQTDLLDTTDKELARLTQVLSQSKTLEQKAENRFSEKQSEIDRLKQEVIKAEKILSEMQASMAVARSITQRGRLTTLARESLAREYREIGNKLSGQSRQHDAALVAELARAEEALDLKRELEAYENRENLEIVEGQELN